MRPWCVGLTGGAGAGKTTVAQGFAGLGVTVVDTDVISRELTMAGGAAMPAIREAFGPGCVDADGALNRQAMRALVFEEPAMRNKLEGILHPRIREIAGRSVAAASSPYVLLVVPLLVEHLKEYRPLLDRILVVDCDEAQQLRRIATRPTMNEAGAKAMLRAQSSRESRLAMADDLIDNRGDLTMLARQIDKLHKQYLDMVRGHRP